MKHELQCFTMEAVERVFHLTSQTHGQTGEYILASVSFWPLLIIESVARVSQHVLFTHDLLVKQV